jgi:cysteine desulfuration protein SufE
MGRLLPKNQHHLSMKTSLMKQVDFVETIALFDTWTEKFNYIISLSDTLPARCPNSLHPFLIPYCKSQTSFHAWVEGDFLRVDGWSNSIIIRGIIAGMIEMFNGTPISEIEGWNDVFFHTESDLINNLTPLRKEGVLEMVRRIIVLSTNHK